MTTCFCQVVINTSFDRAKPTANEKPLPKRPRPAPKPEESVYTPVRSDVKDQTASNSATPKVKSEDIQGLEYFDMLLPLLERLHGDQCGRDKANNRELHFDKYCMLVLLYMFNPTVTSLRAIESAGGFSSTWL